MNSDERPGYVPKIGSAEKGNRTWRLMAAALVPRTAANQVPKSAVEVSGYLISERN
jgi:hypothetical protein